MKTAWLFVLYLVSSPHHSNRMQPVSNYLIRKCRNVSRPREYCLVAEWQPEGVGTDNCPMAPHIQVPLMFRQDHDNDNFRRPTTSRRLLKYDTYPCLGEHSDSSLALFRPHCPQETV
ncbi:hypothetical protein P692DRAFT_201557376 [Suillus brevipes Sb2]|nr:hypothetical protein P692DRAFT_201557376 [Suillus brevipes Sb2]